MIAPALLAGCKKQDEFLNAKPNQSLVVPATLNDFQTILNNTNVFNFGDDPALGEMSSDDYYVLPDVLTTLSAAERNSYTWEKQIYDADQTPADWSAPFIQIYYANTVLDGLKAGTFSAGQKKQYNTLQGTALFDRSYAFYNLVQTFALPYNSSTANSDLGIPLRLSADVTVKSTRASVQSCYDQIIADFKLSLQLLPIKSSVPTQPSQIAANAMLARVYLAISDYSNALAAANACLTQFSTLNDYNNLNSPTSTAINSTFLDEDIYHSTLVNYEEFAIRRNSVADSVLYASYDSNDLRKTKYFTFLDGLTQYPRYVGSYDFTGNKFDGLATDEVYLIRAECYARTGNTAAAIQDLNTLLTTRWVTGTFKPFNAASSKDALQLILTERRKELVLRGLRWTDLRRLNQSSDNKVTLTRSLNGQHYTLLPNDPRYALPIPDPEITISGIQQNQR